MLTFFEAVDAYYNGNQNADREARFPTCVKFEFDSATIRLWAGVGEMYTPDGEIWFGTFVGDDENLTSLLSIPRVTDARSGNSPEYEFQLGYLPDEHYNAIRNHEEDVEGRLITLGNVILEGSSTRSKAQPGNNTRLRMIRPSYSESRTRSESGAQEILKLITVSARNINDGRSFANFGSMNSVGHSVRSRALYGISNDRYCDFVTEPREIVLS